MKAFCMCAVLLVGLRVGQSMFEGWADARSRDRSLPLRGTLSNIPFSLGEWYGRTVELDQAVLRSAAADQFIRRDYFNAAGGSIALYVTYYAGLQRNIPHGPTVCYPMAGWKTVENRLIAAADGNCQLLVFEKELDRQLVLYWHYVNGVRLADASWTRVCFATGILTGARGSVVQVQLATPAMGYNADRALESATSFAKQFQAVLDRVLPKPGELQTES